MTNSPLPAIESSTGKPSLLSIVVPVFNEEESISVFLKALEPILKQLPIDFEIVFINDGSKDRTEEVLDQASIDYPYVHTLNLSRNFGKEAALTAGLDNAQGDAIIPMDVDLQDPPELILQFVEKWEEGYDVVYGKRISRREEGALKRKSAEYFYGVFNMLSPVPMPSNVGDFRLMDRSVIEVVRRLPERTRFMKGIFAWVGFRSIGIPYERPKRAVGTTSWNYWKLWNFALDGVLSFTTVPLRIWSYFGAFFAFISLAYGAFIFFGTLLFGRDVPGYASLMTAVLFFGGIQLLSLGILGEYVGRIFLETKQRPIYVLKNQRRTKRPKESS